MRANGLRAVTDARPLTARLRHLRALPFVVGTGFLD
jgi:hypothetical protein